MQTYYHSILLGGGEKHAIESALRNPKPVFEWVWSRAHLCQAKPEGGHHRWEGTPIMDGGLKRLLGKLPQC